MKKTTLYSLALVSLFTAPTQAAQLVITSNLSTVSVSGSVDDYASGESDGYLDGKVYSSTDIPLQVSATSIEQGTAISSATAGSRSELSLDIAPTSNGYRVWGHAGSSASTALNSLDDNEATALGEAFVDLAFTLDSDFSYTFTSSLNKSSGTGESEVELVSDASGTVFSQIVSEDSLDLSFTGDLVAGSYTLFIGALSEALDGDVASASVAYDLRLTTVPLPTALPLFLSGLVLFGFKSSCKAHV